MKKLCILLCLALLALGLTAVADAEAWDCPNCGQAGNTGNFCSNCGAPKPDAAADSTPDAAPSAKAGDIPDLMQYLDAPMSVEQVGVQSSNDWNDEYLFYNYHCRKSDLTADDLQPFFDALEDYGFRQVNYKYADYISSSARAWEYWHFYCDDAPDAQTIYVRDKKEKPAAYHLQVSLSHYYDEGSSGVGIDYSPDMTYEGNYAGEGYLFNGAERSNGGGGGSSGGGNSGGGAGGSITFPSNEPKTCSSCGGKGTRTCSSCNGKGYVEYSGSTPQYGGIGNGGGSYSERKPCPNAFCHNGQVDCSACGGTGEVY